ncbi:DUF929 domain-containing protein [Stygiolobus caldivivus]|uniref:DUF929 domain-containing protein n=1 Tax=Stygiolobus caldivivus TaxID=2824673 RepID=A0A8D5ZFU1_9CREN|nr:DUF929 domain-containing protein [Stygiolobus caldivivus]BCU70468.1 hypothetical protein KN1_17650 [Stygiolobus caldivivus]
MRKINMRLFVLPLVIIFLIFLILPYLLYPIEVPLNSFIKVSNQDLAQAGISCIIFISWYGCPFGAADSWVLYAFLSHYGKIYYNFSYSDPYDVYPNTPSLIFLSFKPNSSIHFRFLYLYNRYLNATASGSQISNYIQYGLNQIQKDFPNYYKLIKEYVVEKWAQGGFFQAAAYMGNPPHIPTLILISGDKGTYLLIGYMYNPSFIQGMSPQYLITHLNTTFIKNKVETIQNLV